MIGEILSTITAQDDTATLFEPVSDDGRTGWVLDPSAIARDDAIAIVEAAADETAGKVIDQGIRVIGQTYGHVDANALRELLPAVPPNLIGARFLAAAKRGLIVEDGTVRATHIAGHARRIVRWRWVG
jgi:hypothetical protein